MGLIQTESPYYQPMPAAPAPFSTGAFRNDPDFSECASDDASCPVAWGARVIDSSAIYVLSTGLYSLYQNYDQTCINDGESNCQTSIFQTQESYDIWIYNLVTVGAVDMISPLNSQALTAADKKNGYASTLLAWFEGSNQTTGARNFTGYQIYSDDFATNLHVSSSCQTALTATVYCDDYTNAFTRASSFGSPGNQSYTDQVCDRTCFESIASWVAGVDQFCTDLKWNGGAPTAILGMQIWYGLNETCLQDPDTGYYCNDILEDFTVQGNYDVLPADELCSACYVGQLQLMQSSAYSAYVKDTWFSSALAYVNTHCSLSVPTTTQPALVTPTPTPSAFCVSGNQYTAQSGDTCDSIAQQFNVSSASLYNGNPNITDCSNVSLATAPLCLPLTCDTYVLQKADTCMTISIDLGVGVAALRTYNPWIDYWCSNLHSYGATYGNVLCTSSPGGTYTPGTPSNTSTMRGADSGYYDTAAPVPDGALLAQGTSVDNCGAWYTALTNDSCASVCLQAGTVLANLNPSIVKGSCAASLMAGETYCVGQVTASDEDTSSDLQYVDRGCWATSSGTELPLETDVQLRNGTLDPGACVAYCRDQGFGAEDSDAAGIAALLDGTDCLCASALGLDAVQAISTSCATPCAGSSGAYTQCGGAAAVEVLTFGGSGTLRQTVASYGCYENGGGNNIGGADAFSLSFMTPDLCRVSCIPQYGYYAVGNGTACYCGSGLAHGTVKADESSCNTPCGGNETLTCGGDGYLNLFGVYADAP